LVEDIVTYMNNQLEPLNYFEEIECLAELLDFNEKVKPAVYSGKGQWKNIEIDNFNGISYWRKNGDVTNERIENVVGCQELFEITVPLRMVGIIPRKKLSKDDQYAGDRVARTILKALEDNVMVLKTAIQANRASVEVDSYSTNAREIVTEEYDNEKVVNFKRLYLAIEVSVVVEIQKDCLMAECET